MGFIKCSRGEKKKHTYTTHFRVLAKYPPFHFFLLLLFSRFRSLPFLSFFFSSLLPFFPSRCRGFGVLLQRNAARIAVFFSFVVDGRIGLARIDIRSLARSQAPAFLCLYFWQEVSKLWVASNEVRRLSEGTERKREKERICESERRWSSFVGDFFQWELFSINSCVCLVETLQIHSQWF